MTWPIAISDVAESCMTKLSTRAQSENFRVTPKNRSACTKVRNPPYAEHGT